MRPVRFLLAACLALGVTSGGAMAIDGKSAMAFLPIKREAPAPDGAVGLCGIYGWACAAGNGAPAGADVLSRATAVNRAANAAIRPVSDMVQHGVPERWSLPTEQGGDCEDYAIFKKRELVAAGVSADRLLLATVLDRRNKAHAVLILRAEAGDFVLDNVTDRVLPWHRTGYVFLRMQNPVRPAGWVSVFADARGGAW